MLIADVSAKYELLSCGGLCVSEIFIYTWHQRLLSSSYSQLYGILCKNRELTPISSKRSENKLYTLNMGIIADTKPKELKQHESWLILEGFKFELIRNFILNIGNIQLRFFFFFTNLPTNRRWRNSNLFLAAINPIRLTNLVMPLHIKVSEIVLKWKGYHSNTPIKRKVLVCTDFKIFILLMSLHWLNSNT